MRCKFCRRDIPENSMFCNWCGKKQLKDKTEISVPAPRRLKSGTWFAQLMVKGERVPISGSTEAEYYAKARAAKAGLLEAKKPDNRLVKDLVADYIKAREDFASASTIDGYERKARNNLQCLMQLHVKDLTRSRVQAAIDAEKERYSGKTIWDAWSLIQSATGVEIDGLVLPSKKPQKKPPVYSSGDLRRLILALAEIGGEVECAGLLAAWLSLRRSEIFGLRWIDIRSDSIRVEKARVYDREHKLVEKGTKNDTSERVIPCDRYILDKIKALPHEGERVFRMSTSGIWKGITAACSQAGIEHGYLHGLRHTNASIMELVGVPSVYANKRGGWASDHIRTKTYTDAIPEGDRDAAQMVDGYFRDLIFFGPPKPPGF